MNSSTSQLIEMALRGNTPDERKRASEQLVQMGASVVEPLIAELNDDNAKVRVRAATILHMINDQRAVEPLIVMLQDQDYEVSRAAARALGGLRDLRAVTPLIAIFDSCGIGKERGSLCFTLAMALAEIGLPAVEPLISMLAHTNADVRADAARALGKIGDPRAVEPLIAVLHDLDDPARFDAAYALAFIMDPRAIDPLIMAHEQNMAEVREDDKYISSDLFSAQDALEIIGILAVEQLIAVLQTGNEDMRKMAAHVLGEVGDLRAVSPLINALSDIDESVRAEAAEALGTLQDPQAIQPLNLAMQDAYTRVRKTARAALERITGNKA